MPNPFLTAALHYHDAGFSVIPIRPREKIPMLPNWQRFSHVRATREEVTQWWTTMPDANIGIALGPSNGTDGRSLFVVDQDVLKGADGLPLRKEDGSFKQMGDIRGCPPTLSQTTGSGGKQLFYWAPRGYEVGNPKPRTLIDVRGIGGQVLVPPSIHPITGNSYAWDAEPLTRDLIAEFPQDALDALLQKEESSTSSNRPVQQVLAGVPVGAGLRHQSMAQVAGYYLRKAQTPEEIQMARVALYAWDREMNRSPEPWGERKRELDNTFDGILKRELAQRSAASVSQPGGASAKSSESAHAIVENFAGIYPEPIKWLWPDRIATGKLSLIAGDPGLGKSLVTTTIAAIISAGHAWPVEGGTASVGDVVFLSAEDDPADTIRPRLDAAGADVARVHILRNIRETGPDGKTLLRTFSLEKDIEVLEKALEALPECRAVIIDPISAYLGSTDSHNNADIRGLLAPLSDLASRRHVAVIAVTHMNKSTGGGNALYRITGSLAFAAAARAVFGVVKDPENQLRRLFIPVKNNIAQDVSGYAYTIETAPSGAPLLSWEQQPVSIPIDQLMGTTHSLEDKADEDWVAGVIQSLLDNGPMRSEDLLSECKKLGISSKQARNAGRKLGIEPQKSSFGGPWFWRLPGDTRELTMPEKRTETGKTGNLLPDLDETPDE